MAMPSKLFRAIIIGPPGSGKGTIAKRIVKDFGLTHLASGDVLRRQVAEKSEIGLAAEKYINEGSLVPDNLMMKLVLSELRGPYMNGLNWLLDGFPRTVAQCSGLSEVSKINFVINLDVPFDEIINRVKDRYIHEPSGRIYNLVFNPPKRSGVDDVTGEPLTQRHDDKEETVTERLKTYETKTEPVLEYYRKRRLLVDFTGRYSNEIWPEVHRELSHHLQPLQYTEYK